MAIVIGAAVTAIAAGVAFVKSEVDDFNRRRELSSDTWNEINYSHVKAQSNKYYESYKEYQSTGQYGKAITALKESIFWLKLDVPKQVDEEKARENLLSDLIFKSQDLATKLSREFKEKVARSQDDESYDAYDDHHAYIEQLKVILPEDDAFLAREMATYRQTYPLPSLND